MAEAQETQNILKQIFSSSASVAKASEENSSVLQSIYKLQLESEKRNRAAQKKLKLLHVVSCVTRRETTWT